MNIRIENIECDEEEQVLIKCHNLDKDIIDIINYIQSKHEIITGYYNLQIYQMRKLWQSNDISYYTS